MPTKQDLLKVIKMIRKILLFLIPIIITVSLCGCVGYRETNGGLVVSLIGIDREGDEIKMSVQTVLPDTEGNVDCDTVFAKAKNIESAYNNLRQKTVKPLILEHCVGVGLGSTLKKSDILVFLNFAEQKNDINLSINFFCTENAFDFLAESGEIYRQGGYDVIELIKNNNEDFYNKLFMIKRELHKGKSAKLPFIRLEDDEAVIYKTVILGES